MQKNEFNSVFREHVRSTLSPKQKERDFVTAIYEPLQSLLGQNSCIQIGSYPRFTSISPLHDLDVLYIVGDWPLNVDPNPAVALNNLQTLLRQYKDPTGKHRIEISLQTHSITMLFLGGENDFSIDVVPAYRVGKNEFETDTYMVPEILKISHRKRQNYYSEISKAQHTMGWIKTDPRGYIEVATRVNSANNDFRKSVKFVKAWRSSCKERFGDQFKLKAFHAEQVITRYFQSDPELEIYDAVFRFFCELPSVMAGSKILDRTNTGKKIDEYVDTLTASERELIMQARDYFLKKLEEFSSTSSADNLLKAGLHKRASPTEHYLFDDKIPVLLENDKTIKIVATAMQAKGSFREDVLDKSGLITVGRNIGFRLSKEPFGIEMYKWKVKNDDTSPQPRGEITDHGTRNDPEYTQYRGKHFVECYGLRGGVCVAHAKQDIVLN